MVWNRAGSKVAFGYIGSMGKGVYTWNERHEVGHKVGYSGKQIMLARLAEVKLNQ